MENEIDDRERIERALGTIYRWSQSVGDHHKAWVIDRVVRILADDYEAFIVEYEAGGECKWYTGIAP